ncbi:MULTISPECIES: hypothetical protein [Nocardia]|uniref:hypothetical protein n=1 Tax=Nocardia TaxID=1817 RepID=UPI002454457E|nr:MULTISPECIES: hypothetical protein [Nocardia]
MSTSMENLTATDRRLGEALAQGDEVALSAVAEEFAAAGLPAMAQLLRDRGTAGAAGLLSGLTGWSVPSAHGVRHHRHGDVTPEGA